MCADFADQPAAGQIQAKNPSVSPLAPAGGFPLLPVIDGVRFASGATQIRYKNRDDVMLAEIATGSAIAGVFTKSATRSAPVLDCQEKLARLSGALTAGKCAFVVNSGNANAFTGRFGTGSVERVSEATAQAMGTNVDLVFTASTGVIGEKLPDEKITGKIDGLVGNLQEGQAENAARAIMTTDTFAKGASAIATIDGRTIQVAGFAKGSGMIAPDMATMLVFLFTSARISQPLLQEILSEENKNTFNSITVDSDTSTSDTVLLAATGAAGNDEIADPKSESAQKFRHALTDVMHNLALQVVRDGEGATKLVEIKVTGAVSDASARKVALAIANSPLVKTAIAGEDPNWGRIVMAVGKAGEPVDRDKIAIWLGDQQIAAKGWVADTYSEEDAAKYMKNQEISICTDLGMSTGQAKVWTCDLTHRYIEINADYRS